uniref:Uncharacterized protein n=1 Tax=Heterorhabditis bacteriophora TaxID=37862 RepID=A0A1I7WFB3_HETBA
MINKIAFYFCLSNFISFFCLNNFTK